MSEYQRPEPCGTQPITAPRLNLRKFKDYDAPAMFEWLNDGKVLRYFVAPPPKSIEEARKELNLRINGSATQFYQAMDKILLYGEKNLTLTDILISLFQRIPYNEAAPRFPGCCFVH